MGFEHGPWWTRSTLFSFSQLMVHRVHPAASLLNSPCSLCLAALSPAVSGRACALVAQGQYSKA
jgi:hypothetical protein